MANESPHIIEVSSRVVEVDAPAGPMPAALGLPPGQTARPGVLVISDAFGLTASVQDLTCRLASAGYVALAPDLYYRDAEPVISYDNFDKATDRLMRTTALSHAPEETVKDERTLKDLEAALRELVERPEVNARRVGAFGVSTGGRLAYLLACRRPSQLRAVVGFHPAHMVPTLQEAQALAAPLLLMFGTDDAAVSPSEVDRIRAELGYLEKPHSVRVHPGVSDGFFWDRHPSYHEGAAREAEATALDWLRRHLA